MIRPTWCIRRKSLWVNSCCSSKEALNLYQTTKSAPTKPPTSQQRNFKDGHRLLRLNISKTESTNDSDAIPSEVMRRLQWIKVRSLLFPSTDFRFYRFTPAVFRISIKFIKLILAYRISTKRTTKWPQLLLLPTEYNNCPIQETRQYRPRRIA